MSRWSLASERLVVVVVVFKQHGCLGGWHCLLVEYRYCLECHVEYGKGGIKRCCCG
jgi:hypothetical protein